MVRLIAIAMCALVLAVQAQAQAQTQAWPTKPVKLILPFGAGSGLDISARLFAERLGPKWGQPIIVENRPGGDGLIAIGAFVSAADDHVLLLASSANFAAHPYQHEKLPYQRARDLEPIARVTDTVIAVAVPAASGIGSLREFVERARAEPGKLNTSGSAGLAEFALMGFIKSEKLDVARVSYRDAVTPSLDLSEGRLDLLVGGLVVIRPHAEAGKVKVLAVTGSGRSVLAPGVPSVAEAGFPVLGIETTVGYFGPRGMPLALRERIGADIVAAASDATLVARHAATGQTMRPGGPAELAKALDDQDARTAEIAKVLDMKMRVAP